MSVGISPSRHARLRHDLVSWLRYSVLDRPAASGFFRGNGTGRALCLFAEIATTGHKVTSVASGSQQVAVMFAALVGSRTERQTPPEKMTAWGWRVPCSSGCVIIIRSSSRCGGRSRRRMSSNPASTVQTRRKCLRSLTANWRIVVHRNHDGDHETVSFYMITATSHVRQHRSASGPTSIL